MKKNGRRMVTTLFDPAIATLWGCMSMIASVTLFFDPPGHKQKYLQALAGYWDELDAEGERYSLGNTRESDCGRYQP